MEATRNQQKSWWNRALFSWLFHHLPCLIPSARLQWSSCLKMGSGPWKFSSQGLNLGVFTSSCQQFWCYSIWNVNSWNSIGQFMMLLMGFQDQVSVSEAFLGGLWYWNWNHGVLLLVKSGPITSKPFGIFVTRRNIWLVKVELSPEEEAHLGGLNDTEHLGRPTRHVQWKKRRNFISSILPSSFRADLRFLE